MPVTGLRNRNIHRTSPAFDIEAASAERNGATGGDEGADEGAAAAGGGVGCGWAVDAARFVDGTGLFGWLEEKRHTVQRHHRPSTLWT